MSSGGNRQRTPSPFRYSAGRLLILKTITKIHPGRGRGPGPVDLQVQRDELGFPVIYSSSLKGTLKTSLWLGQGEEAIMILGHEPGEKEKLIESSVMLLDAPLLFMPVRSLRGVYSYVTYPWALRRLSDYLRALMYAEGDGWNSGGSQGSGQGSSQPGTGGKLDELLEGIGELIEEAESLASGEDGLKKVLLLKSERTRTVTVDHPQYQNLVVLNDTMFFQWEDIRSGKATKALKSLTSMAGIEDEPILVIDDETARSVVERGLLIVTRVALETREESRQKRVKRGALWSTEYIPRGSVFSSCLFARKPSGSKKSGEEGERGEKFKDAKDVVKFLEDNLPEYLVIGGDETVGSGLVKLRMIDLSDVASHLKGVEG